MYKPNRQVNERNFMHCRTWKNVNTKFVPGAQSIDSFHDDILTDKLKEQSKPVVTNCCAFAEAVTGP